MREEGIGQTPGVRKQPQGQSPEPTVISGGRSDLHKGANTRRMRTNTHGAHTDRRQYGH